MTVTGLLKHFRLSYLPPLMVYLAAGVSGITGVVGVFFVKEHLDLPAAFLASLGFWIGLPWALKMPVGHLIDLLWRWKAAFVYLGAAIIGASLAIMLGLIGDKEAMAAVMSVKAWYVLSVVLAPLGYVVQDAVADAMTVEAVPSVDEAGLPLDERTRKAMHTTMQVLGRVAIIGGGILVACINLFMFADVKGLPAEKTLAIYRNIYLIAMAIPLVSITGVLGASALKLRERSRLVALGRSTAEIAAILDRSGVTPPPNWWILGGSLAFVLFSVSMGMSNHPDSQELVFAGSFAIVAFLIWRICQELDDRARNIPLGTAILVFVFRAVPGSGPGVTWWMIDQLGFDQQFLSILSLVGSGVTLLSLFIFRSYMASKSLLQVILTLTVVGALLSAPIVGMYYDFHVWTASVTNGIVGAREIALVDTAMESPLTQIALVPMLAWIAASAPENLKATFFAVMSSFANLALALSQIGSKWLNEAYTVSREVKKAGVVVTPADYSQLGDLMLTQLALAVLLPLTAVLLVRMTRLQSA